MKIRTLAAGLLVGALALTACGKEGTPSTGTGDTGNAAAAPSYTVAQNVDVAGSPTFAKIKSKGGLTIGVKDDQPGLGQKDPTTGKYSGFDIEIAKLIAAGLGYDESKITYKTVDSSAREAAIANGDVDYYVGTYTITDKRKQQVSFAGPYFQAGQGLLVRKDDNSITGKDTLKGKKVCSVTGSTPIQRVRDQQLTEPGNIVEFQKYSQCVEKLATKEVDAVTTDDAILKGFAAQDPDTLKVVGEPFSQEPYGVGLNKDDSALRNKIDDLLQASLDDGTWQKIYDSTLGKSGSTATKPTIQRY
ncbi:glutamate ABC transporter substrate-binding protein [Amycolatopsis acidiphila]|uniref:Glutamate ABC transporter substrate-binding protein n=1 Tax=Amycolatopsis acidiphila TaxID=715473 RepID=A0A558A956_9PSEU|nr:glutamate ABC transporter substrate-binding protein [Amycolatopsis acidiphila]TVT20795.1 glutamate ABC transporter substrate-binding protein [Amycolatopsis acidiphila]UIJ58342.1 glutamate ABC transporter substrate-binding protein [Amycolatopsis acidiphila]GHG98880.1 ABC transporter substrate-binding protein [Amycolatopsis acidiphila]